MATIKRLFQDTAIYGLSSIIGRFLNYLLVPLYTYTLVHARDYGIIADLYAQTALILVILTFGMETTFFRFINKTEDQKEKKRVYSTSLILVGGVALLFAVLTIVFLDQIAAALRYADHKWYVGMLYLCVAQDSFQAIMFAYLRNQHKPYKFAALKLLFISMSIGLNLLCFLVLPMQNADFKVSVKYVFIINLFCTTIISLLMIKEWTCVRWVFDKKIAKKMLSYTWPLLILGIAGILNQVAGQIMLPRVFESFYNNQFGAEHAGFVDFIREFGRDYGRKQLGIYEACVKIAMIMALITQAFRYAYEPIVFGSAKQKDSKELYAKAMKYFIIFTLVAYLCVIGYMDILQYIIGGRGYRIGLKVVPVVMASEVMMGIVFNLSFWYKLIDKTIYGAFFSIAGAIVLFIMNWILIPKMGYMACAWAAFAGYGTTMVLSYIFGQRLNPINYPLKQITFYAILAAIIFIIMSFLTSRLNMVPTLAINTILIILFLAVVVKKEKILDAIRTR